MSDFDTLFDGKPEERVQEPASETTQEPVQQPEGQSQGETQQSAEPTEGEGASPAPEQGKNVPLSALEAERKQRQDWKEKAIRYEEQLKGIEAEKQRAQAPQQQPQQLTPEEAAFHRDFNQRAHISEMLVRHKHDDVDEMYAAFEAAMRENPALKDAMLRQQSPWEFVYQEGKKFHAMREIGSDPVAYRQKIEDEIRAKLAAESQTAQPAAASTASPIPQSLASARSSAARTAPAFSGPRPFDDIFKQS